jgi:uncharacterized protein YndB with AHSA1/START domain
VSDDPLVEVTLPAPVEEVWRHLRDPEAITRWFGWQYEGLEDEIAMIFTGDGVRADDDAHVLEIESPGRVDRSSVEAAGEGATLRVTSTIAPDSWDGVFDDIGEGWIQFVQQLRFLLERHPGEDRRTEFVEGELWYETEHQRGLVDGQGHLRIVARHGDGVAMTVTAYD